MTKPLYIGVYRDGTGYSQAAIDYILAMDRVGIDVVPRSMKLNTIQPNLPKQILTLEQKTALGCDVVIQHTLPHLMDYNGRFKKNIGLFAYETSNFGQSTWKYRLNCMSEVWVINESQKEACLSSGVTVPIKVVPHAYNTDKLHTKINVLDKLATAIQGFFAFYTVGENVCRKNLSGIIRAFHAEFHPNEPVVLVIKSGQPGMDHIQSLHSITQLANDVKQRLKKFVNVSCYKPDIIITERLSDEEMLKLHYTCHCFVQTSYGEAWSLPAFEAMALGKTPIVPNHTGFKSYINDDCGWLIETNTTNCFGATDSFADLYTCEENWEKSSIIHLRKLMREAYTNHALRQQKAENGIQRAYQFNYDNIGNLIKEYLNG